MEALTADKIRELKKIGRGVLNEVLVTRPDQNGTILQFTENDFIFDFKRRFVDYKRPELPFKDPARLRAIVEPRSAHYILAGRVHSGDETMSGKLRMVLETVSSDDYLKTHVHYLPNYDEKLAYALSVGSNASVNIPIVGLEACGTSWMKDVMNLDFLISTHDGGVADGEIDGYLNVSGTNEEEELTELYKRMVDAIEMSENDFDLEYMLKKQLATFIPVASGARMLRDYLDYLFPA